MTAPLRIGILGAAAIAPMALVRPAREVPGVEVAAVAARDPARARRFAARHRIRRVLPRYEDAVLDPELDALYVPLPNSHHGHWARRALEAGKHVLCEKPLASCEPEALAMAEAAEKSGRVLMEAFHWRHHPLAARMGEILASGELGEVEHVEASLCIPMWKPGDIRFRLELAGGALMDSGCYAVDIARFLATPPGAGPVEPEVLSARARVLRPGIDRAMEVALRFPGGATGRVVCSLLSARLLQSSARVRGHRGRLSVWNPVAPHLFHRLRVVGDSGSRIERVPGRATYTHQLEAFRAAVREGAPVVTDARAGAANLRVIDAAYRAAGLAPREPAGIGVASGP